MIVQKVLRSLHLIFYAKVGSIEEIKDLEKLMMDELHRILTAYEMRTKKENSAWKEENFKESKKIKGHKLYDFYIHELDIEEAQYVRKLKRGSRKHKGKLPFICFNCGRVGNFATKCPYEKGKTMMMMAIMSKKNITI
jgi:hypothetical protein